MPKKKKICSYVFRTQSNIYEETFFENRLRLLSLNFAKNSIIDVWQRPRYASDRCECVFNSYVPTSQNGQTHSNNLSATADKLIVFDHFMGLALKVLTKWETLDKNRVTYLLEFYHSGTFIYYVCTIFRKTNISYPQIRLRSCAYQGVRNVSFPENFTNLINDWSIPHVLD